MRARLLIAGALSAVAVATVLSLAILEFGIRHPSPPSLERDPNPAIPGEIVYRNESGCLVRAPASGAGPRREVACLPLSEFYGPISLVSEQILVLTDGSSLVAYDLETRQRTAVPAGLSTSPERKPGIDQGVAPSGDLAMLDAKGRLIIVTGTTKVEIGDFDVDYYTLFPMIWSPDSQWILLRYQPPRGRGRAELWVVSRDGQTKGTLATDALVGGWASWRIDGVGVTPDFAAR